MDFMIKQNRKGSKMNKCLCAAVLCLLLSGCGVKVSFDMNAGQLYDYDIGRADFNPDDPLLGRRIIVVAGQFNRAMAHRVCSQLLYLDGQSQTEPITLCINSNGGDGSAFLMIRNMMRSISAPVDTVNMGYAASNGTNLFLSATGTRYCVKDSAFLIHNPRGGPKKLLAEYIRLQEELLRDTCDLPDDWLPIKSRQFVLTAEEALEYNVCDAIIEKLDLSVPAESVAVIITPEHIRQTLDVNFARQPEVASFTLLETGEPILRADGRTAIPCTYELAYWDKRKPVVRYEMVYFNPDGKVSSHLRLEPPVYLEP